MKLSSAKNIIAPRGFSVWLMIISLVASCDLPRDNPLDPKAYNYGINQPSEPELPLLELSSFHSSQWFPAEDIYAMEVTVSGASAGFADSVNLVYQDTIFYPLNKTGNLWRQCLESSSFPAESIFDLIGVSFYADLFFGLNDTVSTDYACLYRIIEEVPVTDRPAGNEIAPASPVFSWLPMNMPFSYTYAISLYHVSYTGFVTQIDYIQNISSDSTTFTYQDTLPAGSYYWTIALVDIFNNLSRSKEAAFTVAP